MRKVHGLLLRITKSVDRSDAGKNVENQAKSDLQRQASREPSFNKLLAVDEVPKDEQVSIAHDQLANARDVWAGEGRDASGLIQEGDELTLACLGHRAGKAFGNEQSRLCPRNCLANNIETAWARADCAYRLIRRKQAL